MTASDVRKRLRAVVDKAGSLRAAGKLLGVSHVYIHDVLGERRDPGPKLLESLGLKVRQETTRVYSRA